MLTLKIEHFPESGFSRVSSELNGAEPISLFDVTFSYGITESVRERQVEALEQIVRAYNNNELAHAIGTATIGKARVSALTESATAEFNSKFPTKGN